MAGMDAREAATPARDLGKSDPSFDLGEPERYRKDAPNAQVHILETGYFALDTAADEIAVLVGDFVSFQVGDLRARSAGL